jgi:hypothetical protein
MWSKKLKYHLKNKLQKKSKRLMHQHNYYNTQDQQENRQNNLIYNFES